MRRSSSILVVALVVIGAAIAAGLVHVRVSIERPSGVSASPFWREVKDDGELPPALTVWIDLAKSLRPAVVNVSSVQGARRAPAEEFFRQFFGGAPPEARMSLGSGVIVSSDGYVTTNYHVNKDGGEIAVRTEDQREHRARVVGTDPKTDLALLKIDASDLPTIAFGDSDRLQVAEPVMAIGSPFGLGQTVTTGIVSAKERFIGAGPYDDFIQIDAAINPGNSGGPLINAHGALVGINSAIVSPSGSWAGIGFAIPVNLVKPVLAQLRGHGKVVRGYLGIAVQPVAPDAAKSAGLESPRGAQVAEVVPGSPAAHAGLKPGDIITAFHGAPVHDAHQLTRTVAGMSPGTKAELDVVRPGRGSETVAVTLGELQDQRATAR